LSTQLFNDVKIIGVQLTPPPPKKNKKNKNNNNNKKKKNKNKKRETKKQVQNLEIQNANGKTDTQINRLMANPKLPITFQGRQEVKIYVDLLTGSALQCCKSCNTCSMTMLV
jgi:hypothetical protein